jgi:hypothetical protein
MRECGDAGGGDGQDRPQVVLDRSQLFGTPPVTVPVQSGIRQLPGHGAPGALVLRCS